MVELVHATPELLGDYSKKCTAQAKKAEQCIQSAVDAVNEIQTKMKGEFAKEFGQDWADWLPRIRGFVTEVETTATEMAKFAGYYKDASDDARRGAR